MKLVLLRHGESVWNKENRFTGWTDVDLSENGVKTIYFRDKDMKKIEQNEFLKEVSNGRVSTVYR